MAQKKTTKATAAKPKTTRKPRTTKLAQPKQAYKTAPASIVITNIYGSNIIEGVNQCDKMLESFAAQGHEVANVKAGNQNGKVLKALYECYKRAATGHEYFVYSDGGDTYCQKPVEVPTDFILYSAESNCYPLAGLADQYPKVDTDYKYLNGGGYGGPLKLIIEFFEKYGLTKHNGGANGQAEQSQAFLQAVKDGFPIKLDTGCEVFQTTAYREESEFDLSGRLIKNKTLGTTPAIFHGNGRSPMGWIYKHFS